MSDDRRGNIIFYTAAIVACITVIITIVVGVSNMTKRTVNHVWEQTLDSTLLCPTFVTTPSGKHVLLRQYPPDYIFTPEEPLPCK